MKTFKSTARTIITHLLKWVFKVPQLIFNPMVPSTLRTHAYTNPSWKQMIDLVKNRGQSPVQLGFCHGVGFDIGWRNDAILSKGMWENPQLFSCIALSSSDLSREQPISERKTKRIRRIARPRSQVSKLCMLNFTSWLHSTRSYLMSHCHITCSRILKSPVLVSQHHSFRILVNSPWTIFRQIIDWADNSIRSLKPNLKHHLDHVIKWSHFVVSSIWLRTLD